MLLLLSGLVSSELCQETGSVEHFQNDLFCVKWDVKPYLNQPLLTELRFHVPLDTKQVILEMLFPANLLARTEKTKTKNQKK